MKTIICLISGKGSNLNYLIKYLKNNEDVNKNVKILHVISNNKNAYGLNYAIENIIPYSIHEFIKPVNYKLLELKEKNEIRDAYDKQLFNIIKNNKCDIIYCLGWNYILGQNFISECDNYKIQIINLHPSLPNDEKLIGLNCIDRAYTQYLNGERKKTGIMIHYVIKEVDKGKKIVSNELDIDSCKSKEEYYEKIDKLEKKTVIDAINMLI